MQTAIAPRSVAALLNRCHFGAAKTGSKGRHDHLCCDRRLQPRRAKSVEQQLSDAPYFLDINSVSSGRKQATSPATGNGSGRRNAISAAALDRVSI